MADLSLKMILRTVDRATAPLRKIERAVRAVGRQTGLDKVGRGIGAVGRQMRQVGGEAGRFARRFGLAAIAGGAAAFTLTGRFAAVGDDIAKTADRLGFGVVELQRWRHAAEISGVSTRAFDMAVQRFGRRAAEAAAGTGEAKDALEWLGIQLTDTSGKMRPTEDLMYDVAQALSEIEDPLLRNRVAFKLFDSEGVDVGRMLAQGKDAMRAYGDEAERLGVITEAQAAAAERYTDLMTDTRRALSFLGHTVGGGLLPVLEPLTRQAREFFVAMRPKAALGVATAIAGLREAVAELGLTWGYSATAAQGARQALAAARPPTTDLGRAVRWLRSSWDSMRLGGERWLGWLQETFPPIRGWISMGRAWIQEMGVLRLGALALAAAFGVRLLRAVFGLFRPLAQLALALAGAGIKMTWLGAVGAVKAVRGLIWLARNFGLASFAAKYFLVTTTAAAWAKVAAGLRGIAVATRAVNAAMRANPVLAVVSAVLALGAAAVWVWDNWDGIAAWFGRQWEAAKAAVPILQWIDDLRQVDLWDVLTGWWAGIVAWFGEQWAAVRAAIDWDGLTAWLGTLSLWDVLTAPVRGIVAYYSLIWRGIRAAFDVTGLTDWLSQFTLWDVLTGWWDGIAAWFGEQWGMIKAAFDLDGLIQKLAGIDIFAIGEGWIADLLSGIKAKWEDLTGWLTGAVDAVTDTFDWVLGDRQGSDSDDDGARRGDDGAPPPPSIFPSATRGAAGTAAHVGGEIIVRFPNAPKGTRVDTQSDNRDVPLDVDMGWAWSP